VHALPLALSASAGQLVLRPVQVSARSHSPYAARQVVPAFPAGCVHVPLPLQVSAEHTTPSSVHAAPLGAKAFPGQVVLVPSQVSVRSHSSAAARQTTPAFPAVCWHATFEPLH